MSWAQGAALNLPASRSCLGGARLCRARQEASVLRLTTQIAPGFPFPGRKGEALALPGFSSASGEALYLCAGGDGRRAASESLNRGLLPGWAPLLV